MEIYNRGVEHVFTWQELQVVHTRIIRGGNGGSVLLLAAARQNINNTERMVLILGNYSQRTKGVVIGVIAF